MPGFFQFFFSEGKYNTGRVNLMRCKKVNAAKVWIKERECNG